MFMQLIWSWAGGGCIDVALGNILQLLPGDPEAFPGQIRLSSLPHVVGLL